MIMEIFLILRQNMAIKDKDMNRMTQKHAYTLVEILIGIFILSVGLVSIISVFPMGIRIVHRIKRTTFLVNFAQNKIAEYRTYANPRDTLSAPDSVNHYVDFKGDAFLPKGDQGIMDSRQNQNGSFSFTNPYKPLPDDDSSNTPAGLGTFQISKHHKAWYWKLGDFEEYLRTGVYPPLVVPEDDYVRRNTYESRMGITQNNRRHQSAYGFTRKYILEVWAGDSDSKTDLNPSPTAKYEEYYIFSTGIWNPHLIHSTEWAPVMESTAYQGANCPGKNDYYWPWNNTYNGWGFDNDNKANNNRTSVTDDAKYGGKGGPLPRSPKPLLDPNKLQWAFF